MMDDVSDTDDLARNDPVEAEAAVYVSPEEAAAEEFEAALQARYRRLSLLTLDLAEEAALCAKAHKPEFANFSLVDKGDKPDRFERPAREGAHSKEWPPSRSAAAMTRAIWAHQVIERLRLRHERQCEGDGVLDRGEGHSSLLTGETERGRESLKHVESQHTPIPGYAGTSPASGGRKTDQNPLATDGGFFAAAPTKREQNNAAPKSDNSALAEELSSALAFEGKNDEAGVSETISDAPVSAAPDDHLTGDHLTGEAALSLSAPFIGAPGNLAHHPP